MTSTGIVSAAALAGGIGLASLALTGPAGATPFAPTPPVPVGPPVETVAGGCGPGFHPNPWGVCRPNFGYGPRPFYGRPYGYGDYGPPRPRPVFRPYGFYGPRPYY